MRTVFKVSIVWILVATLGATQILSAQSNSTIVLLREQDLREKVTFGVLPEYPINALKRKTSGVIVMQVDLDETGVISNLEVLESSDPSFAVATRTALKRWRFNPFTTPEGVPSKARGKLTFYFFFKKHRGWCENPLVFQKNRKSLTSNASIDGSGLES